MNPDVAPMTANDAVPTTPSSSQETDPKEPNTSGQTGAGTGRAFDDEPESFSLHQPTITEVQGGVWLVFCDRCSAEEQQWVYPCRVPNAPHWHPTPPQRLTEVTRRD